MTTKTQSKSEMVHFSLEGEWFTWLLRHLWIEGNEAKALRMWHAAFPQVSKPKFLKTIFIDIVSGKSKFSGLNEFTVVEDGTKYWNPDRGGKPSKQFPLLQSWEDVILLKRARLYIAEIELRDFRLNRRFGETYESVNCNVRDWGDAATENNIENNLRKTVNEYWTDIRNLSFTLGLNMELPLIPDKSEKLNTKTWFVPGEGKRQRGDTGIDEGMQMYREVMSTITPWEIYFKKKYGQNMLFYSEETIREICGIGTRKLKYFREEDRAVEIQNDVIQKIIPGMDLDKYISQQLEESKRESIDSEDVKKTKWISGYIDKDGYFYGCADISHVNFSVQLCEKIGHKLKEDSESEDAQIYLDKNGWVKVSVNRFYWDDSIQPTKAQKDTIYDYVTAKNIGRTIYNKLVPLTYAEAFGGDHE